MVNKSVSNKNVLLTGIPRSGTTLTCYLLNMLPDVVALHEPMDVTEFPALKRKSILIDHILKYFQETRALIKSEKKAPSNNENNKVPDNPFGSSIDEHGVRKSRTSRGLIEINKYLTDDFLLVIKHPAAFTSELKDLLGNFTCYAVIRNPLASLASWNSVDAPFKTGHAPAAENLDLSLAGALSQINDRLDRQIYLLSWYFERYHTLLPERNIMKYEDIVSSGGKALNIIAPQADKLNENLKNKNRNPLYDLKLMGILGEKLLRTEGAFWSYYSKDEVKSLLEG